MDAEILLTINLQKQLFADPKRIRLLKEIKQSGSISQAARNAKVSYKSAWDHLEAMNNISPKPLLERNTGGVKGGGSYLTSYAERLLQLYDLLAQTQQKAFSILQDETIPLDSLLSATAHFSLQTSARNQFFGKVIAIQPKDIYCDIEISIEHFPKPIIAQITQQSAVKLKLVLGKEVMLLIKAPWIQLTHSSKHNETNEFEGIIKQIIPKESNQEIIVEVNNKILCYATVDSKEKFYINEKIYFSIATEKIILATLF
ncbi:molybdate transport system regulatory protein [Bisgaardia hudsonensis]|uniref:Molybdate transport system regulatory protein n=1 Tax=Bisgaardia hudsonensis TaxID=109472 RepID=A0A4R2N1T3_9PAST|nr:TOBE domain-containing protein [Bisgaardia hudsonensis]QLB12930.1 molybdenum-dependent transcriptional regulator [Bisgaardia hudsonensis]TCP13510.1 molybdate transport system regulatory protein [Bisgaardia hudsonensis]